MKRGPTFSACFAVVLLITACTGASPTPAQGTPEASENPQLQLPSPRYESLTSLEQAILERRSVREYRQGPLTLAEVSQLLWAAQGVTHPQGLRIAPSAGALYPLEVYVLAGEVEGLPAGIYHYHPETHALSLLLSGDHRQALYEAALEQQAVRDASAVLVINAVPERTTQKYGERGMRYVYIEVGCVSQNLYLQAEALDLGTVFIGAFQDSAIRQLLGVGMQGDPLGLMPVGRK